MTSVQVKDVPSEVHAELRRQAAAAGQSMQEYVLAVLTERAQTTPLTEVFGRVEMRSGGVVSLTDAVSALRADRDAH